MMMTVLQCTSAAERWQWGQYVLGSMFGFSLLFHYQPGLHACIHMRHALSTCVQLAWLVEDAVVDFKALLICALNGAAAVRGH